MTLFNDTYLHANTFRPKHQAEVGDDLAHMGYPDDGNGRYMEV